MFERMLFAFVFKLKKACVYTKYVDSSEPESGSVITSIVLKIKSREKQLIWLCTQFKIRSITLLKLDYILIGCGRCVFLFR